MSAITADTASAARHWYIVTMRYSNFERKRRCQTLYEKSRLKLQGMGRDLFEEDTGTGQKKLWRCAGARRSVPNASSSRVTCW